jgi:nucleotide-binding universal stress UspA family protein
MYQNILVPMDGSPLAEVVLPYIYQLCTRFSPRVTFLHVCQSSESAFMCEAYVERLVEAAEREVKAAQGTMKAVTVPGNVPETILEQADKAASDLILMAAHGYSGRGDWMLGSVTHKVISASRAPVLIIRERLPDSSGAWPQEAIVPLDGSSLSESVLPHVVAMAKTGVSVTLLRVCEPPVLLADYPDSVMPEGWDDHVKLAKRSAENACSVYLGDVAREKLQKEGVNADSTVVLSDRAADGIIEQISQNPSALVVMSTHGRSGFSRWPYGHVTDRVVLASKNPVLLIRPRKR